jgi:predicted transcriptional regulator
MPKKEKGGLTMTSMSMRLPDELANRLEALAKATGRTKSFLAIQAIQAFVEQEAWQVAEIKKALAEADAGDFAAEEENAALDAKWGYRAG